MKYLVNVDFRVMMKGAAVVKSKLTDDFVYDTEEDQLSSAQMKEIAKANKFKIKGKKNSDLKNSLDEALSKLKTPEKKEMSQAEKVLEIVKAGNAAEKSDDEILVEVVLSGVKFQKAGKMVQNAMIELGLSMSSKDRYKQSKTILEDEEFEPEDYSEIKKMAAKLSKELDATSEAQAIAQIRKYCKENDLDIPKKPKEAVVSFPVKAVAWIVANIKAKPAKFEDWLEEQDKSEKITARWMKNFKAVQEEIKNSTPEDEDDD